MLAYCRSRLCGGAGVERLPRAVAVLVVGLALLGACGGKDKPSGSSGNTSALRIVSRPVQNAQVGERMKYKAVLSQAGDAAWTMGAAPAGAAIDEGGNVTWTPSSDQGGPQSFTVTASMGGTHAEQTFVVTGAVTTMQARGQVDPADPNGGIVSVDAPLSVAHGASVQMEPGALPPGAPVGMTISSVDHAPVPAMATHSGVKATDLRPIEFGPTGLAFKKPVRIQLPMSAAVSAKGNPVVQTYDYETGTWHKIKPLSVDAANGTVMAETQHFSTYVVVPDVKAFDLTVGLGGSGSACPDRLVVRAPLALGFPQIPAIAVNGYKGSASNVAEVLAGMTAGQALQMLIRVDARSLSGDGAQSGWVLAAASKQPNGKFKVTVANDTHSEAFVSDLADLADLAAGSAELEAWLNGSRVDFVFAALGTASTGAAARAEASLYLVAAADAARPPPTAANPFASEEVTETSPVSTGGDDDCDGALNQWDPSPNGAAPPVVTGLTPGPLHVAVGGSVTLKVAKPESAVTLTWAASDPSLAVTPESAGLAATVRPSLPGQFQVWVTGQAGGAAARFAWEIIADPAAVQNANTPPLVAIAASASVVRAGEAVTLTALTKDSEQATVTTAWSASDATTLVASAGLRATFMATAPGDYVVTCIGSDGFATSAPARVTITVLSAMANRPPSAPVVSPMNPVLQHAPGVAARVDLLASARDADGDAVTYAYAPDAQTPPTFTLVQAGPNASFSTTQDGTYLFFATATDSHGLRSPWTPIKIQVLTTIAGPAVDADKDGYPAGFDCNDQDPKIFPGSNEVCGDGVDQNCDGRDQPTTACDADGDRFSTADGDCDDKNPARSPAAAERCDGIDNNCNMAIDEGFAVGVACASGLGACQTAGKTVCNAAWTGATCDVSAATPSLETCDGLDNDCNGKVDDVAGQGGAIAETTAGDPANCGGCGIVCPQGANTVAACRGGGCVSSCAGGYADPDRNPANGCECKQTNGGVETCDGTDNDCNGVVDDGGGTTYYDGSSTTAGNGVCRVGIKICKAGQLTIAEPARGPTSEVCDGLDNDCNGKVDDGFDLFGDARNCGGCGLVCPAGVACMMGRCAGGPIGGTGGDSGTTNPADGGVRPDAGTIFPPDGGGTFPDAGPINPDGGGGIGALTVCPSANGSVCADLMNDNGNCGACGRACAATERCFTGVCQSGAANCPPPRAWCAEPSDPAKMYCTDPMSDPRNCGGCTKVCPAGVPCQMGVCQGTAPVTTCPATAPFGCPAANGAMICSDLKYDPANCGSCGRSCPAGVACQGGFCGTQMCPAAAPTPCPTPMGDVCANLSFDQKNCGRCGLVCPSGVACDKGVCGGTGGTMCPATAPSVCPGPQGPLCTNLSSDPANCGNCGIICPAGLACMGAMCGGPGGGGTGGGFDGGTPNACPAATPVTCSNADGSLRCTDVMKDPGNCGMCGRACPAGTLCAAGVCSMGGAACAAPLVGCPNGCVSLKDDPANCGSCGFTCPAGMGCQNGTCGGAVVCATPMVTCGDAATGRAYCTDPNRDPGNCGGCGKACPANAVCSAGVCLTGGGATSQGLGACPGPNGAPLCANLLSDPANCGVCGRVCPAPMGCYGGSCGNAPAAEMCPPDLKTCPDPTGKVYCANVLRDPGNCGVCGRVCPAAAACLNGVCEAAVGTPDGGVTPADGGAPTSMCPAPLAPCPGATGQYTCVDFTSDSKNCGGCGLLCPPALTCQQKACR